VPELLIEGPSTEYSLPQFDDVEVDLTSIFESKRQDSQDINCMSSARSAQVAGNKASELAKELDLRDKEYSSNISQKDRLVNQLEIRLQLKMESIKEL